MTGMDPQVSAVLIFIGLAIAFIVAKVLVAGLIITAIGAIFGLIIAIFAAIFGTIGSIIYFVVKWTKPVWYPILTAILWVWLTLIKVAAVAAIICGVMWAAGMGDKVSAGYNHASTFVISKISR